MNRTVRHGEGARERHSPEWLREEANQEIGAPRRAWHDRGYIPHFDGAQAIQHVTFHLADSLPQDVARQLEEEIRRLPLDQQDVERRKRVEAWIDAGHGSCVLLKPQIAAMTQRTFMSFDAQRYQLLAWVVMPNHVHVLFLPLAEWTVSNIVASWKKFTARKICDHLRLTTPLSVPREEANQEIGVPSSGPRVWHREYWDRYMRSERHLQQALEYIHQNPVKAGLVDKAEDWRWSSAFPENARYVCQKANQEIGVPRKQEANQEIGVPRKQEANQEIGVPR